MQLYAAFVVATTALMLVPGPSVAVIASASISHGQRFGLLAVVGGGFAVAMQLAILNLGLASLIDTSTVWFECLRWAGVAYLIFLGFRSCAEPPVDLLQNELGPLRPRSAILQGFFAAALNPQTLLFLSAFFPQFITSRGSLGLQLLVLSVTFLILGIAVNGCWALLANQFRNVLATHGKLRNWITGAFLVAAGLGLAAVRIVQ